MTHVGFLGVAGGRVSEMCVRLSVSSPWDLASCEALCQPMWGLPALSVSDTLVSLGEWCPPPPEGSERAPGHPLRINETSNYIHSLQGSGASDDPHISEFPHLLPVSLEEGTNYEKVTAKKDK